MTGWSRKCVALWLGLATVLLVGCRTVATGQGPSGQYRKPAVEKTDEAFGRPSQELDGSSDTVRIKSNRFRPNPNTVVLGTTVTWGNDDPYVHNITSGPRDNPEGRFSGDLIDATAAVSYKFAEPGTYEYHCAIHPDMNAQIVVK
ncbi:MAG: cupredoxin domain-containing protein [Acidimicrobiia bacterium]